MHTGPILIRDFQPPHHLTLLQSGVEREVSVSHLLDTERQTDLIAVLFTHVASHVIKAVFKPPPSLTKITLCISLLLTAAVIFQRLLFIMF